LVEATSDPLSLGSLAIPAGAFDQVLAEAQAALSRDTESGGITPPDRPVPATPQPAALPPEDAAADKGVLDDDQHDGDESAAAPNEPVTAPDESEAAPQRQQSAGVGRPAGTKRTGTKRTGTKGATPPKPKAHPDAPTARPAAVANPARAEHGARIPDLGPGLRSLGVPRSFLPPGRRPSLDVLAGVMATLPAPPALPLGQGAVVAVVGLERDLARTVQLVNTELALTARDVLQLDGSASAPLSRQIDRRRAKGSTAVVTVEAGPGLPLHTEVRRLLEQAAPDYVLAAVGAGSKRVDVEQWIGELPTVDALALWDLSRTRTPAELLGVCPIAFVEGEASSTLGWTLLLAGRAVAPRR
jgi:hypothetical protein